ncbi:unnamed protein product [Rhizoctonia solani]|uniref:Zn(2)-C6 fungal-type domain-containing protein n=1 Tax=Rhizoctonia solani TaxID=456999 RepID=A0A8H3CF23_9AGAM|nr:unnamed protein product [Rhizoctonia solani]
MSTSDPIPNRSLRGCLTCKRRKKKCDEKKPKCERCLIGNFECLGYSHYATTGSSTDKSNKNETTRDIEANACLVEDSSFLSPELLLQYSNRQASSSTAVSSDLLAYSMSTLDNPVVWQQERHSALPSTISHEPESIPRNAVLDPFDLDNMKSLIMVEYGRLARRVSFRPFPYPVESALVNHLIQGSSLVCKILYLGARISRALFDDTNQQDYIGWIENLHNRILGPHSPLVLVDDKHLADRLAAHCRLAVFAFMISNSSIGYTIFQKGVPIFLQLAIRFPNLWKDDSTISLSHTLHFGGYELAKFVVLDTIASLAFGIPSLIRYDTAIHSADHKPQRFQFLEPVYACPIIVFMALAQVNECMVSRLMGQDNKASENMEEYETVVRNWEPRVDYADQPCELIARLAVQESWRQAALVYLYMGMYGVDSSDSRVERLVQQVAELASTIEGGSAFEAHLFIPCLIVIWTLGPV